LPVLYVNKKLTAKCEEVLPVFAVVREFYLLLIESKHVHEKA